MCLGKIDEFLLLLKNLESENETSDMKQGKLRLSDFQACPQYRACNIIKGANSVKMRVKPKYDFFQSERKSAFC